MTDSGRLWILGAFATLVVGAVHVQQFMGEVGDVPTISALFLLNGGAAGALVIGLALHRLRLPAALGAIGLSIGALVSLGVARYAQNGLFDYTEPDLRSPVVAAILSELAAAGLLSAYVLTHRRALKSQARRSDWVFTGDTHSQLNTRTDRDQ